MAKAPVVEQHEFLDAVKVAAVTGLAKERDVALLWVAYGTGMMPIELARLTVGDFLSDDGSVRVDSQIRAEIAFNGQARPLYWSGKSVVTAVSGYLAARERAGHGIDHESPLFLTYDGHPFTFTPRKTKAGKDSFSCESLTGIIRRLHYQAGIEGGSALSARRTFGVRLHRKGYDLRHIQVLLGVQSISAVKKMVEADPVRLGAIVSRVM
jgi:site-specific recombinase XerD